MGRSRKSVRLTQERLKELFHYDQNTGIFTRAKTVTYNSKRGDVSGYKDEFGYLQIQVDGRLYRAHRLAWLYVYGYLPENDIDHINRIGDDNRIKNLREVSRSCNNRNSGNSKANTSGVKGVSYAKKIKKWRAQIKIYGRVYVVGHYVDFDNAVCARLAAEQCVGWAGCAKISPAYQYVKQYIQKG